MSVAAGMDPRVAAKIAPPALAPGIIDPKPEWRINFDHWMVNEGPKVRPTRRWGENRERRLTGGRERGVRTRARGPGAIPARVVGDPDGALLHGVRAVQL